MITSDQLRIGNLVCVVTSSICETREITSIGKTEVLFWSTNKSFEMAKGYGNLFPIAISEAWLLRLGFEKHKDVFSLSINDGGVIEYKKDGDKYIISYEIPSMNDPYEIGIHQMEHIKAVHQLQNLYFSLTGKELKTE